MIDSSLKDIAAALRDRKVSAVELATDSLARIDAGNPQINAFVTVDRDGALAAAARICAALVHARGNGHGLFVDVSMTHEVASLNIIAEHALALGEAAPRGEDWLTGGWPCYGVYRTADERFLAVGALEPKFWQVLCEAIGKPHLASLGTTSGVVGMRVRKELADHFVAQPLAHWTEFFDQVDCCVTPVLTLAEAHHHPLFRSTP